MLLKKQTVWLLTMLSLVFVLSVYYFLGNQAENNQMASDPTNVPGINEPVNNDNEEEGDTDAAGTDGEEADANTEEGSAVVNYISGDQAFSELRLELENLRSKQRSDYRDQMANTELPAEEISKAVDNFNALSQIAEKELVLESSIKSRSGVEDALVRVTGEKIHVTVKAKEHTPKLANDIYHLVRTEFTNVRNENIAFEFTSNNN